MNTTPEIEVIRESLPKMGLTDRFFYLIHELYKDYFDSYNAHYEYGFENKNLKHWEASNYLYDRFLQEFGDNQLKIFILSEIQKLVDIFREKYSFQLSFLHNPYSNKAYYLSGDSEFLILAPFFFDETSFKAAVIHELSISEIDDRKYLLSKYQAALAEIKYRINENYVWDAALELGRVVIVDEIVFPERNVMNLDSLSAYLVELQETSLDQISSDILHKDKNDEERLELQAIHPEKLIQLFPKILNRNNDEQLIKNFIATTFKYNFRKYLFDDEITSDILELKNTENTTLLVQTILLMMKLKYIKDEPASFITRVLITSLRKDNKNERVWLSDDLRKKISEWRVMSKIDLAKSIGFESDIKFILFISSSN